MSKTAYFPRASLHNCLELANAVSDLGGSSSIEMTAEKLGKKVSGSFSAIIAATVSFGLVTNQRGQLEVTKLFTNYKLAYTPEEARLELQKAFLNSSLFKEIVERFDNKPLPLSHFEKLLIKEFHIPENYGSRVARYFLDGAKMCGLLGEGGILKENQSQKIDENLLENTYIEEDTTNILNQKPSPSTQIENNASFYNVHITGPDNLDINVAIKTKMQLTIVNSVLEMIRESLLIKEKTNLDD
jgi:hypothetical protein